MSVEREVFEQIDFDDMINQCTAVKEKRISLHVLGLGLKLLAEPKTFYPNNQEMPLVSDFNVSSCHFGHEKYRHRGCSDSAILPYLLEYNSPLFRVLSYDVQWMVQYAKTYMCLNSCMRIYGTCARPLQQEGLGYFYPDICPREKCK